MSPPTVSVVIPVYNGEQYVGSAVESALAQSYRDLEVIVVDDGSSDNTQRVVQRFLSDARVRYIKQANAGVAEARNTAMRASTGQLVAFLDHDDLWCPTKLDKQVARFRDDPDLGLVHTDYVAIDESREIPSKALSPAFRLDAQGWCFEELLLRNRLATLTVMVRRSCIDAVGMFDGSLSPAEDYDLWLRVSRRFRIAYFPEVLAKYRIHDTNMSRDRLRMELGELRVIQKAISLNPGLWNECPGLLRQRLFELNSHVASYLMWLKRDFPSAKRHFRDAIRYRRHSVHTYLRYFWCTLSHPQRTALAWYWAKAKRGLGIWHLNGR